jgi:glutaredoxin 3
MAERRSFPLPDAFEVDVVVYVTPWCAFCTRAKRLLASRGIPFETFDVTGNPEVRKWLVEATGQHTVPQIFIKGRSVGGFTELAELDQRGGLRL